MRKTLVTFWKTFAVLLVFIQAACAAPRIVVPATGVQPAATSTAVQVDPSDPGQAVLIQYSGGQNTDQIALIDLQTGEFAQGVAPVKIGTHSGYAFSPDRTRLAVVSRDESCAGFCLRIFLMRNLQQLESIPLPEMKSSSDYVQQMVFAPASDRLALASIENRKGRLTLVDLSTPAKPSLQSIDFPYSPNLLVFSPGGDNLMLAAHPLKETNFASPDIDPRFYAFLLDTGSLRVTWKQELAEVKDGFFGLPDHMNLEDSYNYTPALVPDVASRRFYIAHADADRLTTVDFERQQVRTMDIHEKRAWFDQLVEWVLSLGARPVQAKAGNNYFRQGLLSSDGRVLYLIGERNNMVKISDNEYETTTTNLGLETWEIDSGQRLVHVDTEAREIRLGTNGEILLGGYDPNASVYKPFTQVFDPAAGSILATQDGAYAYPTLSTNGLPVLVSSYSNDTGNTFLAYYPKGLSSDEPLWKRTLEDGYSFFPEYR